MVGDGLDLVRVFGYGLEMGERGCIWPSAGLKRVEVGYKWVGVGGSMLKMSGGGWKWVGVDGSRWEWIGVDGIG